MSNPGVLSLASLEPVGADYRFEIEDNIGEAIHIHYKDIRLDLTVAEFYDIAEQMEKMIDMVVDVEGFSSKDYDPVNLVGLAACLPDLVKVTEDEVWLADLLVDTYDEYGKEVLAPISESRVVKALYGNSSENDIRKQVNYYNADTATVEKNKDRVIYNLDQIKKDGIQVVEKELFYSTIVIRFLMDNTGRLAYTIYMEILEFQYGECGSRMENIHRIRKKEMKY